MFRFLVNFFYIKKFILFFIVFYFLIFIFFNLQKKLFKNLKIIFFLSPQKCCAQAVISYYFSICSWTASQLHSRAATSTKSSGSAGTPAKTRSSRPIGNRRASFIQTGIRMVCGKFGFFWNEFWFLYPDAQEKFQDLGEAYEVCFLI